MRKNYNEYFIKLGDAQKHRQPVQVISRYLSTAKVPV